MTIDILIILNNFFHDLAAAMWFCGTLMLLVIYKTGAESSELEKRSVVKSMFDKFKKITNYSLLFVLLGGVVRAVNYEKYEWLPALGRDQVTLLVIKHILIVVIVVTGIILQIRLSSRIKEF